MCRDRHRPEFVWYADADPRATEGPPTERPHTAGLVRRTSRKQRVILASGVIVVLAAVSAGIWATGGSSPSTPTFQLVAAASSTLRQTVASTGTIEPAQQANLNFAASGQVTTVAVTVGQKVKAGQVLAKVNSASLSADVAQAEATEASDAAKLSSDQAAGSSVTAAQLTADETAVTAAENQVTDAKQALAEANLTSPISRGGRGGELVGRSGGVRRGQFGRRQRDRRQRDSRLRHGLLERRLGRRIIERLVRLLGLAVHRLRRWWSSRPAPTW